MMQQITIIVFFLPSSTSLAAREFQGILKSHSDQITILSSSKNLRVVHTPKRKGNKFHGGRGRQVELNSCHSKARWQSREKLILKKACESNLVYILLRYVKIKFRNLLYNYFRRFVLRKLMQFQKMRRNRIIDFFVELPPYE